MFSYKLISIADFAQYEYRTQAMKELKLTQSQYIYFRQDQRMKKKVHPAETGWTDYNFQYWPY